MSALGRMWKTYLILLLTLFLTSQAFGQFPWQTPVKRDPAEIKRIVGPIGQREPSRDLNCRALRSVLRIAVREVAEEKNGGIPCRRQSDATF